MKDKYNNFEQLLRFERDGVDFRRFICSTTSGWIVIAPHGGGIEPGTSELAEAIAGKDYSLYTFEGIKKSNNASLHITSVNFDDPELLKLLNSNNETIAIHGCIGDEEIIYVGGLQHILRDAIITRLTQDGIKATTSPHQMLLGEDVQNICNRNTTGKGVQIELTDGLRRKMFASLSRTGRTIKKAPFNIFVNAIRDVMK